MKFPILVPCRDGDKPDGCVRILDGRTTTSQPAKLFIRNKGNLTGEAQKRFTAIMRLYSIAHAKEVDYELLRASFWTFAEKAWDPKGLSKRNVPGAPGPLGPNGGDRVDPVGWARFWLPQIVNQELARARVVMYWPDGKTIGPAIYCPDSNTATFASLLLEGVQLDSYCPGCGKDFKPKRPNQLYCTATCGDRHRHRRQKRNREQ
jgi:hypothetical protein